jgi:hypothetical protein
VDTRSWQPTSAASPTHNRRIMRSFIGVVVLGEQIADRVELDGGEERLGWWLFETFVCAGVGEQVELGLP